MNEEELIKETRKLIGRWDNVRIVGQGWAGDARRGFQFNPIRTSGGGTTPVTPSGACCYEDGTCAVTTEVVCEGGGGTYQGDSTTCDPTGACCMGTDCIITNEDCCTNAGGTYQGDDTACDPNPCETIACPCTEGAMFQPFHDPIGGGYYSSTTNDCCSLMQTFSGPVLSTARFKTLSATNTACREGWTGNTDCVFEIDPDFCVVVQVSCSGEIRDDMGHCQEGCTGCDTGCDTDSCAVGTTNTTTLSDECTP